LNPLGLRSWEISKGFLFMLLQFLSIRSQWRPINSLKANNYFFQPISLKLAGNGYNCKNQDLNFCSVFFLKGKIFAIVLF
jgi:hypothetical protein